MNQTQFLNELSSVSNSYTWTYAGNSLIGVACNGQDRGLSFNPITALARSQRFGTFPRTKRGTSAASRALGLSVTTVDSILSSSNRGNAQVVRGRMLSTLGVS
jgi:hypothetical protein